MPVRAAWEKDAYLKPYIVANYLADLRNNRPVRPSGSRPLPTKTNTEPLPAQTVLLSDTYALGFDITLEPGQRSMTALPQIEDELRGYAPAPLHRRTQSDMPSNFSVSSRTNTGRPIAREVSQGGYSIRGRKFSPTATIQTDSVSPERAYRESGTRWMERQEAISLRDALHEMDLRDEDQQIHEAAQNEAADLVWKHRNPHAAKEEQTAPYRNPDLANNRFKQHLEKGAHARSQSQSYGEIAKKIPRSAFPRSCSDKSISSNSVTSQHSFAETISNDMQGATDYQELPDELGRRGMVQTTGLSGLKKGSSMRHTSGSQRNVSSGSTKGLFRNPEDEIYEEPEPVEAGRNSPHVRFEVTPALKSGQRNSLPRGSRPLPQSDTQRKRFNPFDIHKNPPSQTRNAGYMSNDLSRTPTPDQSDGENVPVKDGLEIRSEDIRAATSMKRKDRSPNLPTPIAVSDRVGRPIVSFDPSWQSKDRAREVNDLSHPDGNGVIPTIIIGQSDALPMVPAIILPDEDSETISPASGVPTINLPTEEPPESNPAPSVKLPQVMPQPVNPSARPLPDPARVQSDSRKARMPWLNRNQPSLSRTGVPTATCANCALPIAGRVVTASGAGNSNQKARFHPECFTCFHCSTGLEAAEFYPEPANKRAERLEKEGLAEDDERAELRFYCHLDFHEFFSPRCRSCKTPIEGEVIIAAGGEWHVGHFFCAECGDPFDSNTPFVEKDGYAWCVSCHTRRTSSRCRGCKKPVLDEITITALGGQWHEQCFVCLECGGGFGEDGRFFIREIDAELTEKERRRGLKPRKEDRAVLTPSVASGYHAQLIATGLSKPRSIEFDSEGNLLVVEAGRGAVSAYSFDDQGGTCLSVSSNTTVVTTGLLNHGLALSSNGRILYASSSESAISWTYNASNKSAGAMKTIVSGMTTDDHTTRTLLLSQKVPGMLLVSRGSTSNLDIEAAQRSSGHSQIKAFNLNNLTGDGYDFDSEGLLLGWGLRNSVGVVEHPVTGGIFSVENSVDQMTRDGKDIHEDNPGEEMNFHGYLNGTQYPEQGENYGYPWCFAAWVVADIPEHSNLTVGSQFAIDPIDGESRNDSYCAAQVAPRLTFQAHMAPLDIKFNNSGTEAWITFHGSWDRSDPVGYKVSLIDFRDGQPVASSTSMTAATDVFTNTNTSVCPDSCFRPVGMAFDKQGRLFVSSDTTGEIYVVIRDQAGNGTSTSSSSSGTSKGVKPTSSVANPAWRRSIGRWVLCSLSLAFYFL